MIYLQDMIVHHLDEVGRAAPTTSSLHPLFTAIRSLTRTRKGVHRVVLDILYTVHHAIVTGGRRNIDVPSCRRRGRISGDLSGNYSGELLLRLFSSIGSTSCGLN
jgi:hypothetical protein